MNYSFQIDQMTWSYSRIQSFLKCPHSFFVHYITGEEEDDTFLASFGSFVHEIHQLVLTGQMKASDASMYYLANLHDKVSGPPPSPEIAKHYIRDGYEYMEHFPRFGDRIVAVE